jgi:hypothetical protein
VSDTSPQRLQTLAYIAECEQKLDQIPPSRRRSLERQAKQQQVMKRRELELEDQLRCVVVLLSKSFVAGASYGLAAQHLQSGCCGMSSGSICAMCSIFPRSRHKCEQLQYLTICEPSCRSSRSWRQTSLGSDSAYEPASTGKLQNVPAPRGFMVA